LNDSIADIEYDEPVLPHCNSCGHIVSEGNRFCNHCGTALQAIPERSDEEKWDAVKQAALFFLIHAVACCVFGFTKYFKTLSWSITFDVFLALVAVFFFSYNWSQLKSVLTWHNFSFLRLLKYCVLAIAGSFLVNIIIDWLNKSLFSKRFSYYAFYADHSHAALLAIFFVAVMPALFEELGYRGFLLGKLQQVTDTKQAIFISSFVFAIMHTSFISLFWLLPFALIIANIRIKQNTLWYGVCIHLCFNLTTIMLEMGHWWR
jgi:membrane protease YdiL (CAAX protease family)